MSLTKFDELSLDDEVYAVRNYLRTSYDLFSALVEAGDIELVNDESVPTACITYDKISCSFRFLFSKKLWEESNVYFRAFVIAHEMLHVMLKHFTRIPENVDHRVHNIATDISINHTLCNLYGFDRYSLGTDLNMCWVDTVFPEDSLYDDNLTSDVYYKIILELTEQLPEDLTFVGNHSYSDQGGSSDEKEEEAQSSLPELNEADLKGQASSQNKPNEESTKEGNSNEEVSKAIEEFLKAKFPDKSIEEIIDNIQAGTLGGNLEFQAAKNKVVIKKKWETLITEKTNKFISDTDNFQWARRNRRSYLMPDDLFIPSEQEVEDLDFEKTEVWFYLDTSGSCVSYAQRFWDAALSLDPKYFNPRLFCFDTKVYEVSMKDRKLYGFGGTSFTILEKHIQQEIALKKIKYPKLIFVITDGWGDRINPEFPKVWNWFLTPYNTSNYLPKTSSIHLLSNFV